MRSISTCLLTMVIVKTVSANKLISIFEAVPFLAYFDLIQCSLLLILTLILLILTAIHFHKSRPCKLTLSRPSTFEYYVLKGEKSGDNGSSCSSSSIMPSGTGKESYRSGTTGTTGTTSSSGISYISM